MSNTSRLVGSWWLILLLSCSWAAPAAAQLAVPADEGWTGVQQALRRAVHHGSLLHVVAHPDDEDGAMLAYVSRGLGARTMLFSLTRGEGGANLISADFFDRLGILRTLEHEAAAQYYGIELFYSRGVDYGYSKTLAEANKSWQGGDFLLADLVRVIRRERPWIIVARFRGDERDGHGHHQMSGLLARKAFQLAGDPEAYPDQIRDEGLLPWRPLKFFHDNINPQWRESDSQDWTLAVDVGRYDPLLGRSYAQIARHGLSFQRSQGMDFFADAPGSQLAYYRELDQAGEPRPRRAAALPNPDQSGSDAPPADDFFTGLDTTAVGLWAAVSVANGRADSAEHVTHDESEAGVLAALRAIDAELAPFVGSSSAAPLPIMQPTPDLIPRLLRALRACQTAQNALQKQLPAADSRRPLLSVAVDQARAELERALSRALGVNLQAVVYPEGSIDAQGRPRQAESGFEFAIPGQSVDLALTMSHQSPQATVTVLGVEPALAENGEATGTLSRVSVWHEPWQIVSPAPTGSFPQELKSGQLLRLQVRGTLAQDAPITQPYWWRPSIAENRYQLLEGTEAWAGRSWPPALAARWRARVAWPGEPDYELQGCVEPLHVRQRSAAWGPREYGFQVAPALSVRFPVERGYLPHSRQEIAVPVQVRYQGTAPTTASVRLELPPDWTAVPAEVRLTFNQAGEESTASFSVRPGKAVGGAEQTLRAVAELAGQEYRTGFVTVTARDLARFNYYRPAAFRLRGVELEVPDQLQVGYVAGSGDEVAEVLSTLGVHVTQLGEADLASRDLTSLDAILVGVRAYAVRDDLRRHNQRLLAYAERGGVVVVQYQTPEFDQNFGPYPYSMGRSPEEVSEQDAAVSVLFPEHPILNWPHPITVGDFDGWVEQRGSKFWTSWDERYQPLLECHDMEQAPQRGGLLYARTGQGAYIYSAYAWYRQLPYAVPGAARLLINQIAHRRYLAEHPGQ